MESNNRKDEMIEETWQRLVALFQHADRTFRIRERYQTARQLAREYPTVAVCSAVFLAVCSIPLMCFVTFAVISTVITFCGFLFVEGVLLTIGTVILSGTLMVIVAVTCGFLTSMAFLLALSIGAKHVWMSCNKYASAWINRFRHQCWEHASYKEVWQSDKTSEPEELRPKNYINSSSVVKSDHENNALKTD